MPGGLEPTETYDGSPTVHVLHDKAKTERIDCASYEEAIETVREHQPSATATKIENGSGKIVFRSTDTSIGRWERIWKREMRRQSMAVEPRDCPYDNIACVADDLCLQCEMDQMQRDT
jgi:hypothetical protein